MKRQSDTDEKKDLKGENRRTSKKDEVVKNETRKDSSSGRQRTNGNRKTIEGTFRLSCER